MEIECIKGVRLTERQSVSGVITDTYEYEYEFATKPVTKILMTLDGGATCSGTRPKAISDAGVGDRVTFTAQFFKSTKSAPQSYNEDKYPVPDFTTDVYFLRPNRASILEQESVA